VIVLDRALTPGGANSPLTSEIRTLMYAEPNRPNIYCMVAGLGGRDVTPNDIKVMVDTALADKHTGHYIYGVRG
jgi:pyruvate/2-oxoacid:ferredoxin oxidoreductase alpha subunit